MNLREFTEPPRQHRPLPYWCLNDELDQTEIERNIREFKNKGFGGIILHGIEGLKTNYLDDDWMRSLRRAFDISRDMKIEAWLHDEERGPSGFAAGKITENNDAFLPRALVWADRIDAVPGDARIISYTKTNENGSIGLVAEKPEDPAGAGVFYVRTYSRGHSHYNGQNYTDLLNPGVIQAYIEKIYDVYLRMFKIGIGDYLPGIVTDGANVNRTINRYPEDDHLPVSFPWSDTLPGHFERLHGYSLSENLHHLISTSPEGFPVRHDFWRAVNDLFIETYTFALSSWCTQNDMVFAGTIGKPSDFRAMILGGGATMPHYEHLGVPMVDSPGRTLMDTAAVKELVSVANQFGKKRMAAKIFGCAGYGRSFGELKATIDRHTALGINTLSPQNISYSTVGDRKYQEPPTVSYHHPAWEKMKVLNDYMARCSWAVSRGRDTASVLVMMPSSGPYGTFDIRAADGGEELKAIEHSYRALVDELVAEHIPFHIGDERITSRYGSMEGSLLRIGYGDYRTVILPPSTSWRKPVVDLLETFTGQLIIMGDIPSRVEGRTEDRFAKLMEKENTLLVPDKPSDVVKVVTGKFGKLLSITGPDGSEERRVLVNHRVDAGAHLMFLASTESSAPLEVTLTLQAVGGVVELDPTTGRGFHYNASLHDGGTRIQTTLAPSGSRIFLVDQTQTSIETEPAVTREEPLTIEGPYDYTVNELNCLVLDRCSLNIDDAPVLENTPVWKVKRTVWEKIGLSDFSSQQPWILMNKKIRSRTNKTELQYRFTIGEMPDSLSLAMEQADRYTVSCNGRIVERLPGRTFLDRRYQVLGLKEFAVVGENVITAETDYLWDTELSPVYVIGDFAVGAEEEGFPVRKRPQVLELGSWTVQGFPFYTGPMIYMLTFALTKEPQTRYELDLSGMRGSVATVMVNDIDVGVIPFPPYRGEITGALKDGDNSVKITVYGTLRNVFGPLHNTAVDDIPFTTAESFRDEAAWTDSYQFIPCGLVKPPRLIRIRQE